MLHVEGGSPFIPTRLHLIRILHTPHAWRSPVGGVARDTTGFTTDEAQLLQAVSRRDAGRRHHRRVEEVCQSQCDAANPVLIHSGGVLKGC